MVPEKYLGKLVKLDGKVWVGDGILLLRHLTVFADFDF